MFQGRSFVVTGAGRGLGRAFALAFAREGAAVVVNDVEGAEAKHVVSEIEAAGGRALASNDDVSVRDQARALIAACVDEFGAIDGLVNNAALVHSGEQLDVSGDVVERIVDVNVKGVLHCGLAAIERMKAQGSGVVLNVTSRVHLGWTGTSLYAATKGAVASATYGWALDAAPYGVRVVALSPMARTRMWDTSLVPLGVLGEPEEVAQAAVYLMSDHAQHLSGQNLRFDGRVLSILHQAEYDEPAVRQDSFTFDDIAKAVAGPLAANVRGVGLEKKDLTSLPTDS